MAPGKVSRRCPVIIPVGNIPRLDAAYARISGSDLVHVTYGYLLHLIT